MSKDQDNGKKLAGRYFEIEDYDKQDETSAGLAVTHEQVSDDYTEGTIDGTIEDVAGENIDLKNRLNRKSNTKGCDHTW